MNMKLICSDPDSEGEEPPLFNPVCNEPLGLILPADPRRRSRKDSPGQNAVVRSFRTMLGHDGLQPESVSPTGSRSLQDLAWAQRLKGGFLDRPQ